MDSSDMYNLLNLLHPSRWDDYTQWFKLGVALKGQDPDGDKGFRYLYETFSERSPNWTPAAADKWDHLPTQGLVGLGTVHMWAKADNPEGYKDYRVRTMRFNIDMLSSVGQKGHWWAAKCVQALHPGRFVSVTESKRGFYAFYDHRWHSGGEARIGDCISHELAVILKDRSDSLMDQLGEQVMNGTRAEKAAADAKIKNAKNLWCSCFDDRWKDCVMRQLSQTAFANHGNKFLEALDAKPNLLGFTNGVLDVATKELRDGIPEDMVSRCCGYDFDPVVDEKVRADILQFIRGCFQTDDEATYYLRSVAHCLDGLNRDEVFHFWTGGGNNGKGANTELINKTLNDLNEGYAGTIDISYFTTQAKSSQSATPEVAALHGRRFVTCSEPEEAQRLQGGKLKKVSGRDNITARALYGQQITFKPQFTIFLQANNIPQLSAADGGTKRRIRVQPWRFEFTDHPDAEYDEKQIDRSFKDQKALSTKWHQQFMLLLLDNRVGHVEPPPQIVEASEQYERQCNPLTDWIDERVIFDKTASTPKDVWYNDYRDFQAASNQNCLGSKQAAQALISFYGKKRRLNVRKTGIVVYEGFKLAPPPPPQPLFE